MLNYLSRNPASPTWDMRYSGQVLWAHQWAVLEPSSMRKEVRLYPSVSQRPVLVIELGEAIRSDLDRA